jgi:Rrf2 family protein
MRLSLQVQYAICGLFDIVYNGQGDSVQVRLIGERQQIPTRYLEQIFQRLRRARLVHGKRGPGGGYTLARPAREITFRDIVEAVEGEISESQLPPIQSGEGDDPRTFRPDFLWTELSGRFNTVLSEFTLEKVVQQAAQSAVPRSDSEAFTYQI